MATPHLVPLTVADPVTARILAAQLGAEGVVWEIRGNVGSPYPVGPVELLVDQDSLDLARELLAGAELPPDTELQEDAEPADAELAPELDLAPDEPTSEELPAEQPFPSRPVRPARGRSWLATAVVLALLVIAVARILTAAL